jgi:hypothetical protein
MNASMNNASMNVPGLFRFMLFGGATMVLLGCRDGAPAGLEARAPALEADHTNPPAQPTGLVQCNEVSSVSASATIGPAGGFLRAGPHLLTVPPGALMMPVTISAKALSDEASRVRLRPSGLQFMRPAFLTMSYANCGVQGVPLAKRIAQTDDDDDAEDARIMAFAPSADDGASHEVTAPIRHLSYYGVSW